jgi:hypothetical protein
MATFINYYPCSYGDSFVAMFSGKLIARKNNLITVSNGEFKQIAFYQQHPNTQQQQLSQLVDGIYSCHRQYQFDFSPHRVVSIKLDFTNFLPTRFKKIQVDQMKKTFANPLIAQLEKKLTFEQLVNFDYVSWSKKNIFTTDIELPLSLIYNKPALKNFCAQYNFVFNEAQVDNIVTDIANYNETLSRLV